jgi:serine/threonine-protein kinase RsbW
MTLRARAPHLLEARSANHEVFGMSSNHASHNPSNCEEPYRYTQEVFFSRVAIERIQLIVGEQLRVRGYEDAANFAVRLAIEEALMNGFRHGNNGDEKKSVQFNCTVNSSSVQIEVIDQGAGFDPHEVPDPTHLENLERPSGRGIMLMRSYMTRVEFVGQGNHVRMAYVRESDSN